MNFSCVHNRFFLYHSHPLENKVCGARELFLLLLYCFQCPPHRGTHRFHWSLEEWLHGQTERLQDAREDSQGACGSSFGAATQKSFLEILKYIVSSVFFWTGVSGLDWMESFYPFAAPEVSGSTTAHKQEPFYFLRSPRGTGIAKYLPLALLGLQTLPDSERHMSSPWIPDSEEMFI